MESKIHEVENLFDSEYFSQNLLHEHRIKSFLLIMALVGLCGGSLYIGGPATYFVIGALALFYLFIYIFSEAIVLAVSGAEKLDPAKYENIYKIIDRLAKNANIPTPKLWLVPQYDPNAFATGRNHSHASVAVTRGILNLLNEDELTGVLAHELSHIKHRDMFISTAVTLLALPLTVLDDHLSSRARRNHNGENVLLGELLICRICSFVTYFMKLAVSRSREYMADESGAKISRNPTALARALDKISTGVKDTDKTSEKQKFNKFFESMLIVSNASAEDDNDSGIGWIEWFFEFFSTHPSTKKRIAKLKELDNTYREKLIKEIEIYS